MPDMNDVVKMIKQASVDAVKAANPSQILFGKVIAVAPLQIMVDQKLILTTDQLILTRNVIDHNLNMTVDHATEYTSGGSGEASFASHNHAYVGKKTFTIHNALLVGETVMMIQVQGGQKFIVIERVVT